MSSCASCKASMHANLLYVLLLWLCCGCVVRALFNFQCSMLVNVVCQILMRCCCSVSPFISPSAMFAFHRGVCFYECVPCSDRWHDLFSINVVRNGMGASSCQAVGPQPTIVSFPNQGGFVE